MKRTLLPLAALAVAASLAAPAFAGAPPAHATHPAKATMATVVDLNSATEAQLAALPGVGDAYAKKIIDNRPYKSKNELVSRKVVPETLYKKFSKEVIATHS